MAIYNKMTILPLHYCDRRLTVPIGVGTDLTVENVEGLLRPEHFDLWSDYVPKKEREDLSSTEIGIVHRFSSEDHIGRAEADSQDKVFKTFVFLRLIRPTRERFSNIQLSLKNGQPDVFSFAQPTPGTPNAPNLQVFNTFHQAHLERLVLQLPKFLHFATPPPLYRIRAVRFFEAGYSQVTDPLLQFVTWMMGIESFLSEDRGPVAGPALVRKIEEQIGSETDIYSEAEADLFPDRPTPLSVGEILPDMLKLRNVAVHGGRVPPGFDDRTTLSPATREAVHYVDVLREGASFVLRNLALKEIKATNV
jgi:hypothetical protein